MTRLQATPPAELALDDLTSVELDVAALDQGYARPRSTGYALAVNLVETPRTLGAILGWRRCDTTADAIGLAIKRELLEAAVREDPDADAFEGWLLDRCLAAARTRSTGGVRAMALEILHEWRLAGSLATFDQWLARGAPSDDRG